MIWTALREAGSRRSDRRGSVAAMNCGGATAHDAVSQGSYLHYRRDRRSRIAAICVESRRRGCWPLGVARAVYLCDGCMARPRWYCSWLCRFHAFIKLLYLLCPCLMPVASRMPPIGVLLVIHSAGLWCVIAGVFHAQYPASADLCIHACTILTHAMLLVPVLELVAVHGAAFRS